MFKSVMYEVDTRTAACMKNYFHLTASNSVSQLSLNDAGINSSTFAFVREVASIKTGN